MLCFTCIPYASASVLTALLPAAAPCRLQRGIVASGEHEGKVVVKVSERFFRPAEVELLLGDPAKAKAVLGWHPEQLTSVEKLCEEMVDSDMELAKLEIMNVEMKKKLKVRAACCSWWCDERVLKYAVQLCCCRLLACFVSCTVTSSCVGGWRQPGTALKQAALCGSLHTSCMFCWDSLIFLLLLCFAGALLSAGMVLWPSAGRRLLASSATRL